MCVFWAVELREYISSQHGPRADNALITCAARRIHVSNNGIKKRLAEAVRFALVDVSGTHVTRTGVNP